MNENAITKGTIVKHKTGWKRVRCVFKNGNVSLGKIFGGDKPIRVPISEVIEDRANWEASWHNSESYRSM
jgi:hypothetical protein